jgi:hypothetical protein
MHTQTQKREDKPTFSSTDRAGRSAWAGGWHRGLGVFVHSMTRIGPCTMYVFRDEDPRMLFRKELVERESRRKKSCFAREIMQKLGLVLLANREDRGYIPCCNAISIHSEYVQHSMIVTKRTYDAGGVEHMTPEPGAIIGYPSHNAPIIAVCDRIGAVRVR